MTKGRKSTHLRIIPNPFPTSKIKQEMYHGSVSKGITKFRRPPEGVWFAEFPEWCEDLYSADGNGEIYACWIDVKNPYIPAQKENNWYYGEMDIIGEFFTKLKTNGYDAYIQGGESGSIAVFDTAKIVNAYTGKCM